MTKNLPNIAPGAKFFIYCDGSQGAQQVFNPSIYIAWILLRLLHLAMLSAGPSFVIFDIRATYFTTKMLGSLQFVHHKTVMYFGIPKYHLVQ